MKQRISVQERLKQIVDLGVEVHSNDYGGDRGKYIVLAVFDDGEETTYRAIHRWGHWRMRKDKLPAKLLEAIQKQDGIDFASRQFICLETHTLVDKTNKREYYFDLPSRFYLKKINIHSS